MGREKRGGRNCLQSSLALSALNSLIALRSPQLLRPCLSYSATPCRFPKPGQAQLLPHKAIQQIDKRIRPQLERVWRRPAKVRVLQLRSNMANTC